MGPLSRNGGDPSTVRVRNVTGSRFEFQIDEWDYKDGPHPTETVSYLVLEAGEHTLADGTRIKAGTVSADNTWKVVSFPSAFGTAPVVFSQTVTVNEGAAVCTRQKGVSASGFSVTLQEQEANGTTSSANAAHAAETVAWVAVEMGSGSSGGREFEVKRTPDAVDHNDYALSFSQGFTTAPALFVQMQGCDGWNPATVRHKSLSAGGATVFIEEEASQDSEMEHTLEVIGWLAIEAGEISTAGGASGQ
jgi:hypothetical protein